MRLATPTKWVEPLDHYAAHLRAAGQSENTVDRRLCDLKQIAREVSPEGPELITGKMLVQWSGSKEWSRETRRGRRASAISFWRWAVANGYATEDASAAWDYVHPAQPRPRPVPDRIYRPALEAAGPRERIMLRLGGEMGLRRAEIAFIHVGRDLSEDDEGWWLIVHGKGNKDRTMPVPDELARLVRAGAPGHSPGMGYKRNGWLFPGKQDGHLSPRRVGKLCGQLLQDQQDEGEDNWGLHKCRHRFGSRALKNTRNIRAVQEALGHVSVATTQIYCAITREEVREAVNSAA